MPRKKLKQRAFILYRVGSDGTVHYLKLVNFITPSYFDKNISSRQWEYIEFGLHNLPRDTEDLLPMGGPYWRKIDAHCNLIAQSDEAGYMYPRQNISVYKSLWVIKSWKAVETKITAISQYLEEVNAKIKRVGEQKQNIGGNL